MHVTKWQGAIWGQETTHFTCFQGEIHIWRRSLKITPSQQAKDFAILNEDEKKRAQRYFFDKHRRRFIAARAGLRCILSRYLNLAPVQIHFNYAKFGKPELSKLHNPDNIRFNVSHSGDLALYALLRDDEVGIDIEKINRHSIEGIAERFFAKTECEAWVRLPSEQKKEAFYRIWTQKEAFIKAVGEGLSYPLDKFSVNVTPPAGLLTLEQGNPKQWRIQVIEMEAGYSAALAIQRRQATLRYFKFN